MADHRTDKELSELDFSSAAATAAALVRRRWSNTARKRYGPTMMFTPTANPHKVDSPATWSSTKNLWLRSRKGCHLNTAPLLCAGVTVYSPLSHFGLIKSGLRGGIVGLGGVGHMGVLIAKAMGHHVTVISSSNKKREEAINVFGADEYIISSDSVRIQALAESLDYVIDTVPTPHPIDEYLSSLKVDGKLILVGVSNTPLQFLSPLLITG